MNLKNFLFATALTIALLIPSKTFAQYGTYTPSYSQLTVDKQVRNPVTGIYVDNLGLNDAHYFAENAVFFRITVQNTGNTVLSRITATDYLPAYLSYVSGGVYTANTRQIVFYFDNVSPGERRSTILQARVNRLPDLPVGKSLLCPVNKVVASAVEAGTVEDTAQLCIQKTLMAKGVPQTGDPIGLLMGLGSLPMLFAGFKLGKKK